MPSSVDIMHLHGFKCAGTTFAWILEKNFPGQVAYVESMQRGDRLPWQRLSAEVDLSGARAVSSHLVSLPAEGEGLARMNVAFVRNASARLRSAYDFQRSNGSLPVEGEDFGDFLKRIRTTTLANYQTRHLSVQDFGGWESREGWQLRPELIRLNRSDLFVGLVEKFDESLVILERKLSTLGITFDASYPNPKNRGVIASERRPPRVPKDMTELDDVLHERVWQSLEPEIQSADFPSAVEDFQRRCELLRVNPPEVRVAGPEEWTYLA
jgi:hypothetical protein